MTTVLIDKERTREDPLFKKVNYKFTSNGLVDESGTKNMLGQGDVDDSNKMNFFASFFNRINKDIVGSNFGLLNLSLYILLSGIMSINSVMNMVHNSFGGFYNSFMNNQNDFISNMITFGFTFLFTVILFTMFNDSRESFYNFIQPMINSSSNSNNLSVILLNLMSSVFSGFMSFSKLFFISSYSIFTVSSIIKLLSFKSSESMSAALFGYIMMLSFVVSSATILVEMFSKLTSNSKIAKQYIFHR